MLAIAVICIRNMEELVSDFYYIQTFINIIVVK